MSDTNNPDPGQNQNPGFIPQGQPPQQDPTVAAPAWNPPQDPTVAAPAWNPPQQQAPQQNPTVAAPVWNPSGGQNATQQVPIQTNDNSGSSGGNKWLMRGALVAAAVVLLGGIGAALKFTVFDKNGEDTPEAAADAFVAALDQEDPLGLIEVMLPSEFESTIEPANAVVKELVRLEYLSDAAYEDDNFSLGDTIKIEVVEPIEYESQPLVEGFEDIQEINFTGGKIQITSDPTKLNALRGTRANQDNINGEVEVSTISFTPTSYVTSTTNTGVDSSETSDEPLSLVAVKEDGGYYISLYYSIAEAARKDAGAEKPDFANPLQPQGADSPEEALTLFMDRLTDLDFEATAAIMDPQEFRAMYDYWSLIQPELDEAGDIKAQAADEGFSWDLNFEARSEERDGRTVAIPTAMSGDFQFDDGFDSVDIEFSLDDSSFTANGDISGSNQGSFDINVQESDGIAKGTVKFNDGAQTVNGEFTIDSETLSGSGSLTVDGETVSGDFRVDGDCVELSYTLDGETESSRECDDSGTIAFWIEYQETTSDIFSDLETPGLTVVERDGKWYVSGAPTFYYIAVDYMKALTPEEIDQLDDLQDDLLNTDPFALEDFGESIFSAESTTTSPVSPTDEELDDLFNQLEKDLEEFEQNNPIIQEPAN